ncbi:hypothetical protein IV203_029210 [Nitzschia inconspicua]|uniref:Uncharacterized protein n=1 Tax=Nitzschia inconspicua TaxID=303405 RepID=A0A9K3LR74_9STRA|nr:hypothetical protein IV203_029210 [Nitzschia inconspicua]
MRWTQSYAHDIGLGGSYGHHFKEVMIPQLVHFDGILIRDGLKQTLKLNDNKTVKKKGEEGYEPAYKYDFIFDVVCHNVRVITDTASLDLCGNELSWAHQGWEEP